jgi:hypothetical protein
LRYAVTGKGGVLIGDLILSVGSASAALKQSTKSREDFKCVVVVTDEQGHPVSAGRDLYTVSFDHPDVWLIGSMCSA